MPNLAELSRLDATKLHAWANRFNWDDDLFGPTQALRNPRCAQATALLLYWRAKPHFYRQWGARKDVPADQREAFDLLRAIERALRAGVYRPRGITYDPRDDRGNDLTAIDYPKERKVRDLPPDVLVWTDGTEAHPLAPLARATTATGKTAKKLRATKKAAGPRKPATRAEQQKTATKKEAVRVAAAEKRRR